MLDITKIKETDVKVRAILHPEETTTTTTSTTTVTQ